VTVCGGPHPGASQPPRPATPRRQRRECSVPSRRASGSSGLSDGRRPSSATASGRTLPHRLDCQRPAPWRSRLHARRILNQSWIPSKRSASWGWCLQPSHALVEESSSQSRCRRLWVNGERHSAMQTLWQCGERPRTPARMAGCRRGTGREYRFQGHPRRFQGPSRLPRGRASHSSWPLVNPADCLTHLNPLVEKNLNYNALLH
jgi:hypothetical protein